MSTPEILDNGNKSSWHNTRIRLFIYLRIIRYLEILKLGLKSKNR